MIEILNKFIFDLQDKTGEKPECIALTKKQKEMLLKELHTYSQVREIRFAGIPIVELIL